MLNKIDMKIGFIGAGKVGSAFGRYLKDHGVDVVGYSSRTVESAAAAAEFTMTDYMSMDELVEKCNYIFITTSDNDISYVWNQIKKSNLQDKKIFHMSGSLSSHIFEGLEDCRALGYSLHPLFPFTDKLSYRQLDKAIFTIEGKDFASIEVFLKLSKINYFCIDERYKAKYHAAAVFVSNYVVALAKISKTLFVECGLPKYEADMAIHSLIEGTVDNIRDKGVEAALTGPFVRGDTSTILRHLESIDDVCFKQIYCDLGKVSVGLSRDNGSVNKGKAHEIMNILGGDLNEKNNSNI